MGNQAYIETRLPVSYTKLRKDLEEISRDRFNGTLHISPWVCGDGYSIGFIGWDRHIGLSLQDPHHLEIGHASGDLLWWIDFVITNDLALKYDGVISDDAIGETWKGEPGKYPTFANVLDLMYMTDGFECPVIRASGMEFAKMHLAEPTLEKLGPLLGE